MTSAFDQLDEAAMDRIAERASQLMRERGDVNVEKWIKKNRQYAWLLAHCTWLATREELERRMDSAAE